MRHYKNIIIAGDLFDHWKVDPIVINKLFSVWDEKVKVYAIPGQHDLPQHSLDLIDKSSFQVLVNAGAIIRLSPVDPVVVGGWYVWGAGWGESWPSYVDHGVNPQLLVAHKTTWMEPFAPGQARGDAARLLMANPGWQGILVGDNHQTFAVRAKNRMLVSAGSLMRMRVDQMQHKPCCFTLGVSEINDNPVYLPVANNVMTSVAHDARKVKDERIDAFVSRLQETSEPDPFGAEVELSFADNMQEFLLTHDVEDEVKGIIAECTEG
jgi:DNA repair exonuclease SbcCD nuclease subunit